MAIHFCDIVCDNLISYEVSFEMTPWPSPKPNSHVFFSYQIYIVSTKITVYKVTDCSTWHILGHG